MVWMVYAGIAFLLALFGFLAFKQWDKSFRNWVHIARQTGSSPDDVIWIKTRFKVVNDNGTWTIRFRHIPEKTGSIEGKFWTKFYNPRQTVKMNDEAWKRQDMSKKIQRGLYLYESSEGVFYPMSIARADGAASFRIIDQDNRAFLINEIEHVNSLTKDRKRELIGMIAIIIGVVVIGALIFGGMFWIHKESQDSIAQTASICGEYARAVFNTTATGKPEYLGNIPVPTPGG